VLLIFSGFRRGEILGLRVRDCALPDEGYESIEVTGVVREANNEWRRYDRMAKTTKSKR
jgi:integrase